MDFSRQNLPQDISVAHQMIVDLLAALDEKDRTVDRLRHQLEQIKERLYGRRSEKMTERQWLFEYAGLLSALEASAGEDGEPAPEEQEGEEAEPVSTEVRRKRNGTSRRQVASNLPVERVEHTLSEEECRCAECGGPLRRMGEEVTRQIDYIPASFYIREHVRVKYSCPRCQGNVVVAKMPSPPIEKGLPGAGLLAHVLTSKYADHLPLYRMEQIVKRHGIAISRKTMCDWVRDCARLLKPVYDWLKTDALASKVVHTDDTPVPVRDGEREKTRQGRLWVYVGDGDHPQVVYDYTPTRSRDGPLEFLGNYSGYLQADAYAGYDELYRRGDVEEVGCWAHARRKYWDARKTDRRRAYQAVAYIARLYRVEREAREYEEENGLSKEERVRYRCSVRREKSRAILDEFKEWLGEEKEMVLPKSPMGEAIGYTLGQWDALKRYVEDGALAIDNNVAEQNMRPVAIGRKNWLFAGSDNGGRRAAVVYSLIQTCKRHGIDPFAYLRDVLDRIADHPITRIEELTPLAWKRAQNQASPSHQPITN